MRNRLNCIRVYTRMNGNVGWQYVIGMSAKLPTIFQCTTAPNALTPNGYKDSGCGRKVKFEIKLQARRQKAVDRYSFDGDEHNVG